MTMTAPTQLPADRELEQVAWRLDPTRSSVEFQANTLWGLVTVKGRFERYEGRLDFSQDPAIELAIDAASLDTGHAKRDKHLRSEDFFAVDAQPHVRFMSDRVIGVGERLHVHGELHGAGRSVPLEIVATLERDGDEYDIAAETTVDQRELGMTHSPLRMLRHPVKLIVRGRLVRDEL
jgi:polyisoprenoid-binding protein YceI